jgi:crotonobetainyl-CoA:carnitine CoA-transferase CaiB-like acyl-CoA transferase
VTSTAPLEGSVVVEIGHSVAAPFAGLVFAQLGAEVIKVEHPAEGDHARRWGPPVSENASALFHAMNRDKRGIALDLRKEPERNALIDLIVTRADVVIQNLRPNSVAALGLGAQELTRLKPSLIYCNLSAFGGVGPLGSLPGYDPLMQAYGGLMSVTGEDGRPPVRIGVSIIDVGTGMWSVIGVLAALLERSRTRRGGIVDTSLYETAVSWMGAHIAELSSGGADPRRHGSGAPQIVPYQVFDTADGQLMVAAGNDPLFVKLCAALGQPQWTSDERFRTNQARVSNRLLLTAWLQEIFRTRATAQWRELLDTAGIPNAPLQSAAQVAANPQTDALQILERIDDTQVTAVGLPIRFDGSRPTLRRSAPRLGEHTRELVP